MSTAQQLALNVLKRSEPETTTELEHYKWALGFVCGLIEALIESPNPQYLLDEINKEFCK